MDYVGGKASKTKRNGLMVSDSHLVNQILARDEAAFEQLGGMPTQADEKKIGTPTYVPQWPVPNVRQFTS